MSNKTIVLTLLIVILSLCVGCRSLSNNPKVENDGSSGSTENIDNAGMHIKDMQRTVESEMMRAENQLPDTNSVDEISELINNKLDIIVAGYTYIEIINSNEFTLINSHTDEFAEIVSLGESALPYLEAIIISSGNYTSENDRLRGIVSASVSYAIKPELYDLTFPSSDEKYLVKADIYSFEGIYDTLDGITYGNIYLVDCVTDSIIWSTEINAHNLSSGWSSDSRYFTISYDYHWISYMNIFDTQTDSYIIMPRTDELTKFLYEEKRLLSDSWREFFYFGEWCTDETIKILFNLRQYDYPHEYNIEGWYIYDLTERKIVEADCTVKRTN